MKTLKRLSASAVIAAATASTLLAAGTAHAAPAKYSQAAAATQLRKAGITWTSSGRCSDWNKKSCTSFTNMNRGTVSGVIAFKKASRCRVVITGGTEKGHASGRYSHRNGYKVDISRTSCVNTYVTNKFKKIGKRGDGALQYRSPAGNVYALEGTHWDVTYFNGRA